jgi:hypothetical protein
VRAWKLITTHAAPVGGTECLRRKAGAIWRAGSQKGGVPSDFGMTHCPRVILRIVKRH